MLADRLTLRRKKSQHAVFCVCYQTFIPWQTKQNVSNPGVTSPAASAGSQCLVCSFAESHLPAFRLAAVTERPYSTDNPAIRRRHSGRASFAGDKFFSPGLNI